MNRFRAVQSWSSNLSGMLALPGLKKRELGASSNSLGVEAGGWSAAVPLRETRVAHACVHTPAFDVSLYPSLKFLNPGAISLGLSFSFFYRIEGFQGLDSRNKRWKRSVRSLSSPASILFWIFSGFDFSFNNKAQILLTFSKCWYWIKILIKKKKKENFNLQKLKNENSSFLFPFSSPLLQMKPL